MCDSFLCFAGCMSIIPGCTDKVLNKIAFFPPNPSGYRLNDNNKIMLLENKFYSEINPQSHEHVAVVRIPYGSTSECEMECSPSLPQNKEVVAFEFTSKKENGPWIIYSHGNSTDIGYMFHFFKDLSRMLQANILAYEYPGYGLDVGKRAGPITEDALSSALQGCIDYLVQKKKIDSKHIVLYGQSIGSCPSISCAAVNSDLGGLIVHSGLKSGLSVIRNDIQKGHWFDVFRNEMNMEKVKIPVFVLHGKDDVEIPISHGISLYEAAENKVEPWWVEKGGHNDIEDRFRDVYMLKVYNFLKHIMLNSRSD